MKRNPRVSTVLFLLLLLVGLGVLLYPTASDLLYRWQAKREVAQYNQVLEGQGIDYSDLWEAAEAYNRELLDKPNQLTVTPEEADRVAGLLNPLGNGMMGYIRIPKIHVELPIYQGTKEQELQAGAGYWLGSSLPTGGPSTHCVLTAHNGLVKAKMFTDLDQLEVGDRFTVSILDRDMTYEVDKIQTTLPDNIEPLYITEGMDYVTLYTCVPYGVNTHRLLVRGHRVTEEAETQAGAGSAGWPFWLLGAMVLLLLLVLLPLWIRRRHRKKRQAATPAGEGGGPE